MKILKLWKPGQCVTILGRKCRIIKVPNECSGFYCDMCELGPCDLITKCRHCISGCAPVHIQSITQSYLA